MQMRISDEWLELFFPGGANMRRSVWPAGDYISSDGAEGGTIWYYSAENDDLLPDYKLGFHDLAAGDWDEA